jgi:hypothetical protein
MGRVAQREIQAVDLRPWVKAPDAAFCEQTASGDS